MLAYARKVLPPIKSKNFTNSWIYDFLFYIDNKGFLFIFLQQ